MSETAEGLLHFRKAAMNAWELTAASVIFSHNFLKWGPPGFCSFTLYEGKNAK